MTCGGGVLAHVLMFCWAHNTGLILVLAGACLTGLLLTHGSDLSVIGCGSDS